MPADGIEECSTGNKTSKGETHAHCSKVNYKDIFKTLINQKWKNCAVMPPFLIR